MLANAEVHEALVTASQHANAWLLGRYVIMPDHLHLFCAPRDETHSIEHWITFWKRSFRRSLGAAAPRFQAHGFPHRLRQSESYADKWNYVRLNPVRAGLVTHSDDWPFQGELNELRW